MNYDFKRVIIKVGTNVLTDMDGLIDNDIIANIVQQILVLKSHGIEVVLVSSGAVGAGKAIKKLPEKLHPVTKRQVYAAIGQIALVNTYNQFLQKKQVYSAQVLATKEDFRDRVHYVNMKQCLLSLLRDDILPIVNENDVISISELMFTDNDELSSLLAAMVNADALIILSNIDGVYKKVDGNHEVIPTILHNDKAVFRHIQSSKSSFGRGGMVTKLNMCQKTASLGINCFIANGKRPNILMDILVKKGNYTHFPAAHKKSNLKKWMAHTQTETKGAIFINEGAEMTLKNQEKTASLLPIGITKIDGSFQKGDMIEIKSMSGTVIGYGIAKYSSATAISYIGKRGKRPVIHYDYLFVV